MQPLLLLVVGKQMAEVYWLSQLPWPGSHMHFLPRVLLAGISYVTSNVPIMRAMKYRGVKEYLMSAVFDTLGFL